MTSAENLPEPGAHPTILSASPELSTTVRSRVSQKRLGLALFVIGAGWVFANSALNGVLLAAKLAILSPDNKVSLLGLTTALGAVVSSVALFGWGAVSDLTRSRFGRRAPWIVVGGVGGAIGLVLIALAQSPGTLIAAFLFYAVALNALPAAVIAVFPDRVPVDRRGSASAVYGGAQVIAGAAAGIVAAQFLQRPDPIFYIAAAVVLVTALIFVALAPDFSSKDQPREQLDMRGLRASLKFPSGAPDFYWAFAGRFLLLLGLYMVQNFSLYILTDFFGLPDDETARVIALTGVASLVTITIGTVVAGPVSDRIGRRKLPIFFASLLFGAAVLFPLLWHSGTAMIVFGAVSGLGLGAFLSVDAALMTEVLPSEESRGKDLGILNAANTVPGVLAPLVTSGIVAAGFGYRPVFVLSLTVILIGAFSIFKIKSVR